MCRSGAVGAVLIVLAACAAGPPAAPAATDLAGLTGSQLAGQRVVYSYRGLRPPASLLARIRRGEAAGLIFFADNIRSRAQIRRVVRRLQRARMQSAIHAPLLMMTDQEGGLVRRLPGPPERSARQIGRARDSTAAARRAGRGAALNLRGVGINVNLAPVLDVHRASGDFIDRFQRSFSRDTSTVARLGSAFLTAQQRAGVAATVKHFPGLGAAGATENTDLEPVTLPLALATLRDVDMFPYRAAIEAGVRLVMASWATYPALDPKHPAGLSRTIVQGELRDRLGFRGTTITDAIEAGALRRVGGIGTRCVAAARAGEDLLLLSGGQVSEGDRGRRGLARGLRTGAISRPAFQASVERILALRASL